MSARFDKETTSTTAKSLLGALIALGSGFVFMFCGLVAVTANNQIFEGDPLPRRAVREFRSDMLSCIPGTMAVSEDQTILRLQRDNGSESREEIVYTIRPDSGEVSRSVDGEVRRLANLPKARFERSDDKVSLIWQSSAGETRAGWAVNRWTGKAL